MVELWIDGDQLILKPGIGLAFQRKTPLFKENIVEGSRSYNIAIPFHPVNDRIFNHARHLNIRNKVTAYTMMARFGGSVITIGKFILLDAKDSYNGTLTIGEFTADILDKNLKDFTYGPTQVMGTTSEDVVSYCQTNYPTLGYSFQEIWNIEFYDDKVAGFQGVVNKKVDTFSEAVNVVIDEENQDNRYAFCPNFYLFWMMGKIAEELGYVFDGDLFEQPELEDLTLIGNSPFDQTDVNDESEGFVQIGPAGYKRQWLWSTLSGYWSIEPNFSGSNYVSGDHHAFNPQHDGLHDISYTAYMTSNTQTFLTFHLEVTIERNGIFTVYDTSTYVLSMNETAWVEDEILEVWLEVGDKVHFTTYFINSNNALTLGTFGEYIYSLSLNIVNSQYGKLNVFKKEWEYADHVPDMKLSELFLELKKVFNVAIIAHATEKRVTFNICEEATNNTAFVDWSKFVVRQNVLKNQAEVTFGLTEGRKFIWENENLSGDVRTVGDGTNEYSVKLSPLDQRLIYSANLQNGHKGLLFGTYKASTPLEDIGDNDAAWRFSWPDNTYRALQLRWNAPPYNDIFTTFWEKSIQIELFAEEAVYTLDLDFNTIQRIDFLQKILIDGIKFMLISQKNEYTTTVGLSEVTLKKM